MDEPFELPVSYKGKELLFTSQLLMLGYTHKFQVNVNGQEVLFEPDEERTYRAIVEPETQQSAKHMDIELLQAIADAIEAVIK
jgi:hypothetical protein